MRLILIHNKMIRIFSIILILTGIWDTTLAQDRSAFRIITDREVYVSGETVLAKLYLPFREQSKIVYADIASLSGEHITGVTTEATDHQAAVYIELPDSLETAAYLVRVFVNEIDSKTFAAQEILVANRFDKLTRMNDFPRITEKEISAIQPDGLNITGLMKEYQPSAAIKTEIAISDKLLSEINGNLLVSVSEVVPRFDLPQIQLNAVNNESGIPEDKGIVINGTVVNTTSSRPIENATIFLTIPDSIPYFQYYNTGADGKFSFLIKDRSGRIPLVIQCFDHENAQPAKIILEKKFNIQSPQPKTEQTSVPAEIVQFVEKTADARLMKILFEQELINNVEQTNDTALNYPYYGRPTKTVDPDLFYDLPDFNEISRELLPSVRFRNTRNGPQLRVLNLPAKSYFQEQPLILVDGIPISNVELIKDMGTSSLDRVDYSLTERFYGNLQFPGIVALYTKTSENRPIRESDRLVVTEIEAKQPGFNLSQYTKSAPNIPDIRQTLLWNPSIPPAKNIALNFQTSEIKGTFRLVVCGTTKSGEQFIHEQFFEVK